MRHEGDGTWHVKAGSRVRVRLSFVAPAPRYHVALVDPVPAGFEIVNPSLRTTEQVPDDPSEAPAREGWFEHQDLHDERACAFASFLWDGTYTYSYVVRASTRGRFSAPPPRAEEMYSPETFGRGASDRVRIE